LGSGTKSPILVVFLSVILLFQVVTFGGIQNVNADSVEIPKILETRKKIHE